MPVTKVEFERSVHRGLGRAVLWLSRGEIIPDRDFILYACTHNLAYDRQTEDNRALYMLDIIQATGDPKFYSQFVVQSLSEVSDNQDEWDDDEWCIYQMFDLVGLLATSGDLSAKQALYAFFEKHENQSDSSRAGVIVDVDGLEGYLAVIHRWLQHPRQEDDHWYEAWLMEEVEKRFSEQETWLFLERSAQDEPEIGAYLAEVREKQTIWHERQKTRPERHWPDYGELQKLIFDTTIRYGPMVWARYGEHLPDADAEQIACQLLAETDPKRLARYLLLFKRRPFPLNHSPLLAFAQSANREAAAAARAALAQVIHPAVRTLALELMGTSLHPWELIEMLILNFQAGDEQAIEHVLNKAWDADELEWIGRSMRHVFEKNPTPAGDTALLLFYEFGYCTMCRHGTVELLAEIGPLPPHIIEEGRYDAYDGTRELVQAVVLQ